MTEHASNLFFAPIQPFVWNPTACFIVASLFGLFLVCSFGGPQAQKRPWMWGFVVPAATWVAFGWYEGEMRRQQLTFHIDILFLAPLLYLITAIGIGAWLGVWLREPKGR
jgi:hypothetical protein